MVTGECRSDHVAPRLLRSLGTRSTPLLRATSERQRDRSASAPCHVFSRAPDEHHFHPRANRSLEQSGELSARLSLRLGQAALTLAMPSAWAGRM